MRGTWTLIVFFCLLLPGRSWVAAQGDKDDLPAPGKPIKREQIRFDGRTFEQWRVDLLTDLSAERRVKALKALRAFAANGYATEAAAAVVELMGAYDVGKRWMNNDSTENEDLEKIISAAARVLDVVGDAANPELLRALQAGQRNRVRYVLDRLEDRERDIEFAVAALDKLATDKDEKLRERVFVVLAAHGQTKGVAEVFARHLKEDDQLCALKRVPSRMDISLLVPTIDRLASDKRKEIRETAINVLVRHLQNKGVAESLGRVLEKGDRVPALNALIWIQDIAPVVANLAKLASGKDEATRDAAIIALGNHLLNQGVAPALQSLMKQGDEATRLRIVHVLLSWHSTDEKLSEKITQALPLFLLAFQDRSPEVRSAAIISVWNGRLSEPESEKRVQQALAGLLTDPDAKVCKNAYDALVDRSEASRRFLTGAELRAVPELLDLLRREQALPRTRIRAITILRKSQADGKNVLEVLNAAAKDKNPEVRKAAEQFNAERLTRLRDLERQKTDD
jgi:hypothetical protein